MDRTEFESLVNKKIFDEAKSNLWEKLSPEIMADYQFDSNKQGYKFETSGKLNIEEIKEKNKKIKGILSTLDFSEESSAIIFLEKNGLLDEYVWLLNTLNVTHTMQIARHFWCAKKIREFSNNKNLKSLEIGGGAGTLAVILFILGISRYYTIIDLPEMLLVAGKTFEDFGIKTRFIEPSGEFHGVYLSVPSQLDDFSSQKFDVVLNFNSFSEMKPLTISWYLRRLPSFGQNGTFWFTVNRIQNLFNSENKKVRVNPLLWEYPDQNVLFLEPDYLQMFCMNFGKNAKTNYSIPIFRIAVQE